MNKLLVLLVLLLTNTAFAQEISSPKQTREANAIIQAYCQADQPGMAVGIIKNGEVIYKNQFGLANLEHQIAITDSTAFNIASVSKQFTAFAAVLAEQEGKLSLDDDIKQYLPELEQLPYKITLRQLANHTHGLPNFSEISQLQGIRESEPFTHIQSIYTVLGIKEINFQPGAQYQYNNTGFMLLAEILERVYKTPFQEIVREQIFEPLNMQDSEVVDYPDDIIPNRAAAYRPSGETFIEFPNRMMENGSSNLHTTLNDFCKWAINFQEPKVGSRSIFDKMQESTILNSGEQVKYGLGLQTGKYKGLHTVFHGGGTAGYRAYILHVPAHQFSVVALGNKRAFDILLIVQELVDLYLGEAQSKLPMPNKTNYTASELKDFEGIYKIHPGNYFEIISDGENLLLGTYNQGDKSALKTIGDGKFDVPFIPTTSISFEEGSATYDIADFSYHCEKVELNLPKLSGSDLEKFVGFYRNDAFNTIYQLVLEGDQLIAKHSRNYDIYLNPLSKTSFYSTNNFFGQLDFSFEKNDEVSGFRLSGQNLNNIAFRKID